MQKDNCLRIDEKGVAVFDNVCGDLDYIPI